MVTKILDLDVTFTLPDGSEYRPFTTVWEVNTFFRIQPDYYSVQPSREIMDSFISNIYRDKVAPKEESILDERRQWAIDFFRMNVWWAVSDADSIDTLLQEIRLLSSMEIIEINDKVIIEIIDWIIMNLIWMRSDITDWEKLSWDKKKWFTVWMLEKDKFTDYFVNLIVDLPWIRSPNNPQMHMIDTVQRQIQSLYAVNNKSVNILQRVQRDSFRNTRYI